MEITFHVSQICLFSAEFCLSFRTLLYQSNDFISHIKCVFQQWNIFLFYPLHQDSVSSSSSASGIFHSVSGFVQQPSFWFQSWSNIQHISDHKYLELSFIHSSTSLMQATIVSALIWVTGIRSINSSHTVISLSPNVCKLQAVQCCSDQCSHQPWYCRILIQLCHFLHHSTFRPMI